MKKVLLVVHCYAKVYSHFATCLNFLLSSLVLHPVKKGAVSVAICKSSGDNRVDRVTSWFQENTELDIKIYTLDEPQLGRRCIGRNIAALDSGDADLVWFADTDYVFRGCLDRLLELDWPVGASMIYPTSLKVHKSCELGDAFLKRWEGYVGLADVEEQDFIWTGYGKAIGGIQIVRGEFAREHGYLNDSRWQRVRADGRMFGDFRDDVGYRRYVERYGSIVPVSSIGEGLYRIRHIQKTYKNYQKNYQKIEQIGGPQTYNNK